MAIKQAELDRKKQHIDDEYQREKKRQEIRDKYGIAKKAQSSKDKQKVLSEMKKEYGMSDEEARELQQKMFQVCLPQHCLHSYHVPILFRIRRREMLLKPKLTRKWRREL